MAEIKVEKRDGQLEEFDRIKVRTSLVKAGALPEEAENITTQIETWAQTSAVNGVIKSSGLRAKVLELLRSASPKTAVRFEKYRKGTS